jgi:hypothetical protein
VNTQISGVGQWGSRHKGNHRCSNINAPTNQPINQSIDQLNTKFVGRNIHRLKNAVEMSSPFPPQKEKAKPETDRN